MAGKISIQGAQPKLSVKLSIGESIFKVVEKGGTYIVKPQSPNYKQLPENEDLTMHLASIAGFKVPWHGLIRCEDESLSYVIKRFDRKGRATKIPQEDFAQLMGATSTTKYLATMEDVAGLIEKYCTFQTLEWLEFFRRTIFCFLIGNEDMHLKNFSVLTENSGKIRLTPFYDFLNTTIAMPAPQEELALSLGGAKKGFNRKIFIDQFAVSQLAIPERKAESEIDRLVSYVPIWKDEINKSFLTPPMKKKYLDLLVERAARLKA